MLTPVEPPDFATAGPATLRNHAGDKEHWFPVCLLHAATDSDTGDPLPAHLRVWQGPYGHLLSDSSLKAIWMNGHRNAGSHCGMS